MLEEVVDPGHSGASLERPGIDRVWDLVACESISMVLAQDRDRFAREPTYHFSPRCCFWSSTPTAAARTVTYPLPRFYVHTTFPLEELLVGAVLVCY